MNERIKELAKQADGFFHPRWDNREGAVEFQAKNLEKFAELIVRECAKRLMQDDFGSVKGVMSIAGARLKEHFGVE